jgi:hypothetical protein
MSRRSPRDGKQTRPRTTIRGKRYLCARCRKRSPRPVKTPAPWYCPQCLARDAEKPEEGTS